MNADLVDERLSKIASPISVLLLGCCIGLVGFFDRGLIFHDEILNTGKAHHDVIFDYALRPTLYAINWLALRIFGDHTYSLTVAVGFSFVGTALVVYHSVACSCDRRAGLFAAVAFLGHPLVYKTGIHAMSHMHVAFLISVSVWCLLVGSARDGRAASVAFYMAGLTGMAAVSAHQTAAAYLVGACAWVGLKWVRGCVAGKRPTLEGIAPPSYMALGCLSVITLLAVMYPLCTEQGYFATIRDFFSLIQDTSKFAKYLGAWHFYIATYMEQTLFLSALAALSLGTLFVRQRRLESTSVFLTWLVLASLVVLSFVSFKFDRVLIAYIPLAAMLAGCASYHAIFAVPRLSRTRLVPWLLVILAGAIAMDSVVGHALENRRSSGRLRHKYLSLYEASKNLEVERVGLIAKDERFLTRMSAVEAAGLEAVLVGTHAEMAEEPALVRRLRELGLRAVVVDFKDISREHRRSIRATLESLEAHLIMDWRGIRALWYIDPNVNDAAVQFASALEGREGTRIGVLGQAAELDPRFNFYVSELLRRFALRSFAYASDYGASRIVTSLRTKQLPLLLMPYESHAGITGKDIESLQLELANSGAKEVARFTNEKLQLWLLSKKPAIAP